MKKLKLVICLMVSISFSLDCFSQTLSELDKKNGFREIKLGSNVLDYPYFEKQDSSNIEYFGNYSDYNYIINHKLTKKFDGIGNGEIKRVLVKTHNYLIYEILVLISGQYSNIERMLELNFGKSGSLIPDYHTWRTDETDLSFIGCTTKDNQINCKHLTLIYSNIELTKIAKKAKLEVEKEKARSEF